MWAYTADHKYAIFCYGSNHSLLLIISEMYFA